MADETVDPPEKISKEEALAARRARYRTRRATMSEEALAIERAKARKRVRKFWLADPDRARAIGRRSYAKHREKQIREARAWAVANPERRRAAMRAWYTRKYPVDIQMRLSMSIRSRVAAAISGRQKPGSIIASLGCTIPALKEHLEKLFLPGMTWENWGRGINRWHIDHRKPLASFDLTDPDQFREACHYTNLQPLWWHDNIRKGAKIIRTL